MPFAATPALTCSLDCNQPVVGGINLDAHVLEFVEQSRVVHLPRDRARLARRRVFEAAILDPTGAYGLGHRHPGATRCGVDEQLDLMPGLIVKARANRPDECRARVVVTGPVIP